MASSKTAKLTASAPVLFVRDVYAATKHYRDTMGFSFDEIFGEPPSFAILKRDNMYVMVKQIEDHKHIVPRWTVSAGLWDIYFWVDNVDALYKEFVERGAKIDYELCDQPYGLSRIRHARYRRARYRVRPGHFMIAQSGMSALGHKRTCASHKLVSALGQ